MEARATMRVQEMAARRSFTRSMGKFVVQVVDKPVAILTAFRGEVSLADNRRANAQLAEDLKSLNLGFYPVKGAGQEERRWLFRLFRFVVPSSEESFIVQPRARADQVTESEFLAAIAGLLQKYDQYGAVVKLPSSPQAFILRQHGRGNNLGSGAGPTTAQDDYYTQLHGGPRADSGMLRPWEIRGEGGLFKRFANWWNRRSFMNRPADRSKIGQRFSIKDSPQSQESEEV
jgi:hypothetical protein